MFKKKKVFIGGEKVIPFSLYFSKRRRDFISENKNYYSNYYIDYTFGGYHSLLAIIEHLKQKHNSFEILLPSYLCHSVLTPFKQRNVDFFFYKVDGNLDPDFVDIKAKITKEVRAILFIDYMGKSLKPKVVKYLDYFECNGIEVIQDLVQNIDIKKEHLYGDFIFNSYRKQYSFEGSILLSKKPIGILFERGTNYRFIINKRIGQILRFFYLNLRLFSPKAFLFFIGRAEECYYSNKIYRLPSESRHLLNRVDSDGIKIRHQLYYEKLLLEFESYVPEVFRERSTTFLGFFIQTNRRDEVRMNLRNSNIFCPIHWLSPSDIGESNFSESHKLSEQALTIPISDLDESNFEYLKYNLKKHLTS
ncbi:MAG: hypothetical protein RBT15_10025 [Gudongella sp.]|jgi:hypothetical protein|nr:hypothetical protein [Gudongella sp.]